MKTLNLHCDYINFQGLKKALKNIDEIAPDQVMEGESKDCLVVLTAVEKGDNDTTVEELVNSIIKIAKDVNTKEIVLYPYAHLSSNLGSPKSAVEILNKAKEKLTDFNVIAAPFGYYKSFELKVKGHPLSELSREFKVEGNEVEEDYDPKKLLKDISKAKLDTSKLKDNDHRIIGKQMDLFSFNEVAPGMIFWHNNGMIIRKELIKLWRELHHANGYEEIQTPQIMDKRLWQISGHWDKYKENIFLTNYEKREFAVKPMNCPGGALVFKSTPKSYKDLPIRAGELGIVHRQELSGVLGGLFRVIQFTQDDAHIFCTEDQLNEEIKKIINLIEDVYAKFGFKYSVELSTRPEKRIGEEALWDKAEEALETVMKDNKMKFKVNKGDGAFYGPKIDFHLTDSLNRTWQCATIQLDFSMPERFDLEYTDSDNTKKRPIMLHRVIYGSLERFIGILIEHFNGRLPTWLAPKQVRILNFTDRNTEYAKEVLERLKTEIPELRIDSDFEQTTVQSKIKSAELMKIPHIATIGDREQEASTLAVRRNGKVETIKLEDFIVQLKDESKERK